MRKFIVIALLAIGTGGAPAFAQKPVPSKTTENKEILDDKEKQEKHEDKASLNRKKDKVDKKEEKMDKKERKMHKKQRRVNEEQRDINKKK